MSHSRILFLFISFFYVNCSLADFDSVREPIRKNPIKVDTENPETVSALSHAQDWARLCIKHMNPEEVQLTANILYLLYVNALIDTRLQQFYTPIAELTQAVLWDVAIYTNAHKELVELQTVLKKLSTITVTRDIYTHMYNAALTYYDQNKTIIVDQALEALQLYGQDCAHTWADDSSTEIAEQLKNCSAIVNEHIQHLRAISGLYKGLSDGQLPVTLHNEEDKSLFIIDTLLTNAGQATKSMDLITSAFSRAADKAMSVLCKGTALYELYYNVLYTEMASSSFDQKYVEILFGPHGLLKPEQRVRLPHPKDIFEHMLHITHAYKNTKPF